MKYDYKTFKKASKWLMQYKSMNIFRKIVFQIQLPFKYREFKKVKIVKEGNIKKC